MPPTTMAIRRIAGVDDRRRARIDVHGACAVIADPRQESVRSCSRQDLRAAQRQGGSVPPRSGRGSPPFDRPREQHRHRASRRSGPPGRRRRGSGLPGPWRSIRSFPDPWPQTGLRSLRRLLSPSRSRATTYHRPPPPSASTAIAAARNPNRLARRRESRADGNPRGFVRSSAAMDPLNRHEAAARPLAC